MLLHWQLPFLFSGDLLPRPKWTCSSFSLSSFFFIMFLLRHLSWFPAASTSGPALLSWSSPSGLAVIITGLFARYYLFYEKNAYTKLLTFQRLCVCVFIHLWPLRGTPCSAWTKYEYPDLRYRSLYLLPASVSYLPMETHSGWLFSPHSLCCVSERPHAYSTAAMWGLTPASSLPDVNSTIRHSFRPVQFSNKGCRFSLPALFLLAFCFIYKIMTPWSFNFSGTLFGFQCAISWYWRIEKGNGQALFTKRGLLALRAISVTW